MSGMMTIALDSTNRDPLEQEVFYVWEIVDDENPAPSNCIEETRLGTWAIRLGR